jgi:hypothetical protein
MLRIKLKEDWKVERPLYRYSEKKWNDLLLSEGNIRIGTLFDFRNTEHKAGIADPAEGKKFVYHDVDDWRINDEVDGSPSKTQRAMSQVGAFAFEPGGGQRMSGVTLRREILSPDFFIHCSSYMLSRDVMKEFEGAETCVEIHKVQEFYQLVTAALNEITEVRFDDIWVIQYRDRDEEWNGQDYGGSGCLIKESIYKRQFEVRAVWSVKKGVEIAPVNLVIPGLVNCCRPVTC